MVDTSIIVAAVTREERTAVAQAWLRHNAGLSTARWTLVECMSALSVKLRTKSIEAADRDRSAAQVRAMLAAVFDLIDLTPRDFTAAAAFCERAELGLRGPDALHLAIADRHGATLWTLDRRMAEMGQALGIAVRLLG